VNNSNYRIYFGFFLIYFTISIFDAFFIIYIPLFYLRILNVDYGELAYIHIFTYLTLLVSPLLGFLYDRYVEREIQSKMILYICCITLCGSFSIFILFKEILLLYGIFVCVYFFSKSMIRTEMSGLFLSVVRESDDIKLKIILLVNAATITGYLAISLLFNFNVLNITSIKPWNSFFLLGWLTSFPIIFVGVIFNKNIQFFNEKIKAERSKINNPQNENSKYDILVIGILFISFILANSDLLISYPLSSWIYDKFTETGFRIYSSLYFIFFICSILGLYIANSLCKKYNEKKMMCGSVYFYMILLILVTFSTFPMFMILNSILSIILYIISVSYTSLITEFSNKGKYGTFKFQFLQTSSSIASIIFIPLGTFYFDVITVETLIIFSSLLIGISGLLIMPTFLIDKGKKVKDQKDLVG